MDLRIVVRDAKECDLPALAAIKGAGSEEITATVCAMLKIAVSDI